MSCRRRGQRSAARSENGVDGHNGVQVIGDKRGVPDQETSGYNFCVDVVLMKWTSLPAGNQIAGCRRPLRKRQLKARSQQTGGHDAAAFQDELRFRPHQESADFNEPFRVGKGEAGAPRLAQGPQESMVRERSWRSDVYDPAQLFTRNQELDRPDEVRLVNPGNKLCSRALSATQAVAH